MKIFNIYKNIKGFVRINSYGIKFNSMIQDEAQRKVKIITFFEKHGLNATLDAFNVSKSSIYLWRQILKENNGKMEALNNKSRRPHRIRKRIVPEEIKRFIIDTRYGRGKIGKVKISRMLKDEKIAIISGSTAGRMISDLKRKNMLKDGQGIKFSINGKTGKIREKPINKRKKQRRKDYIPEKAGNLLQLDTITKFINGVKRYVITAIDLKSDFAFAYGYERLNSANAKDFFIKLKKVCPFEIERVQTDNGLEFEKYFRQYMEKTKVIHYHNYPRSPKMNAYIERFNRTIQEEFMNANLWLMKYDVERFNEKLMDYLVWYNTKRPRWSLDLISPLKYLINHCGFSNMYWTYTCHSMLLLIV